MSCMQTNCPLRFQAVNNVNHPATKRHQYHGGGSRLHSAKATEPRLTLKRSPLIHLNLLWRHLAALKRRPAERQGPAVGVQLQRECRMRMLSLKSKVDVKSLQHGGQKNRHVAPQGLQWDSQGANRLSHHPQNLPLLLMHHSISHQMMTFPLGERSRVKECTGRRFLTSRSQATCFHWVCHQSPLKRAGRNWGREPESPTMAMLHKNKQNINREKAPTPHRPQRLCRHDPAGNTRKRKANHWFHKSKMTTSGPRKSLWSCKSKSCTYRMR